MPSAQRTRPGAHAATAAHAEASAELAQLPASQRAGFPSSRHAGTRGHSASETAQLPSAQTTWAVVQVPAARLRPAHPNGRRWHVPSAHRDSLTASHANGAEAALGHANALVARTQAPPCVQ